MEEHGLVFIEWRLGMREGRGSLLRTKADVKQLRSVRVPQRLVQRPGLKGESQMASPAVPASRRPDSVQPQKQIPRLSKVYPKCRVGAFGQGAPSAWGRPAGGATCHHSLLPLEGTPCISPLRSRPPSW